AIQNVEQLEMAINNLDRKTTAYLVQLSKQSLSGNDSDLQHNLFENIRDIERIGDHVENIVELLQFKDNNKIWLSDEAYEELVTMYKLTMQSVEKALQAVDTHDTEFVQA